MLYFSRWKVIAILLTAGLVCSFAIPNFFPEAVTKTWPAWAQRRLVLGLDLQGGSQILLEVDLNDVRKQRLDSLRDDARRTLRDSRIAWSTPPIVRGNSVEVRLREGNEFQNGLTKARHQVRQALDVLAVDLDELQQPGVGAEARIDRGVGRLDERRLAHAPRAPQQRIVGGQPLGEALGVLHQDVAHPVDALQKRHVDAVDARAPA